MLIGLLFQVLGQLYLMSQDPEQIAEILGIDKMRK